MHRPSAPCSLGSQGVLLLVVLLLVALPREVLILRLVLLRVALLATDLDLWLHSQSTR